MTLGETGDRELAAGGRAVAGDEAAFRPLYRRHTPALYRLALRLGGGDEAWAEELVQRAWIRAVEGLAAFAWRATFRTWLSGIAVNCARELWRERRVARGRVDDGGSDHRLGRARRRRSAWTSSAPSPAAAGRPPGVRAARRRRIHPRGDRELLGIEAGTSKSQLSHARRRLRETLATRRRGARRAKGQRMMRSVGRPHPARARGARRAAAGRRACRRSSRRRPWRRCARGDCFGPAAPPAGLRRARLRGVGALFAAALASVGRRGARAPAVPGRQAAVRAAALRRTRVPAARARTGGRAGAGIRRVGRRAGRPGELVAGEKLREDADVVIEPAAPCARCRRRGRRRRGWPGTSVIRASDPARALEIARSCPHVRYGGSIVIREIEPT